MPLRLEIKKKFSSRSERVKSVDFHSQEPWILAALYSGHVVVWNHQTQATVKTLEVCDLPVRCAKFIDRKQWVVCGADDLSIRVYNYNTMERVKTFEAHTDYIRCIAVHPTLPYILTSSDDMSIKLWDWDKGWECQTIFEGHTHYVMQVEFNPKDTNTFASASLDRSVKVWGLNSPNPHFSLEGHERGVNCVAYFRGGDRPYLVSGADDNCVKIWDYQTKTCVATLEGHTNNVSAVCFHPTLPIILTGAEDGTVRIWHATTYRLENTLNYGMERVWSISCLRGSNRVAIGYDEGTIMIKLGHEEPVVSMERGGKIVWAKNNEIVIANVKTANLAEAGDGDRLPVQTKELGSCEVYPQSLKHNPNGRLLCVCGDGEYIIYTALSLKNKSFGNALEFVWSTDSGVYGTRESSSKVKVFKNFKEHKGFRPSFAAEGIFGGALLGVRSSDFIDMYDWNECRVVRRIDVCPRKVYWSESGDMVVLCCDASYYVLRYNSELVQKFFDQNVEIGEQGVEGAFDLEQEISEKVRNGYFVGDCFLYTNSAGRLNYYVGGEVMTLAHLPKSMYLMGYLAKENRVYLMDKQYNVYTYSLLVSVLVYQTAIVRQDLESAAKALTQIPEDQYNKIARFLEAQDLKEMALQVSKDPEHKFELAMQCKKLQAAREILLESESEQKWRQLGDAALNQDFDLKLAEECFTRCKDLSGLLLLYTSQSNRQGMARLAEMAREIGHHNVAFLCYFHLARIEDCINLLCDTGRVPEAAFMARTYMPSAVPRVLDLWKAELRKTSKTAAEALADPREYKDLFPNMDAGVSVEQYCQAVYQNPPPASQYPAYRAANTNRDLLTEFREGKLNIPSSSSSSSPSFNFASLLKPVPASAVATPVTGTPSRPGSVSPPPQPADVEKLRKEYEDRDKAAEEEKKREREAREKGDAAQREHEVAQQQRERAEKERIEKERAAKEKADKEKADKEKAEHDRIEREHAEQQKAEKERKEKEAAATAAAAVAAAAAVKQREQQAAAAAAAAATAANASKSATSTPAKPVASSASSSTTTTPAKPAAKATPTPTPVKHEEADEEEAEEEEEEEEEVEDGSSVASGFQSKKEALTNKTTVAAVSSSGSVGSSGSTGSASKAKPAAAAVVDRDAEEEEEEEEERNESGRGTKKPASTSASAADEDEEEEDNELQSSFFASRATPAKPAAGSSSASASALRAGPSSGAASPSSPSPASLLSSSASASKATPAKSVSSTLSSSTSSFTPSAKASSFTPASSTSTPAKPAAKATPAKIAPAALEDDDEGPSLEELNSSLEAIDNLPEDDWGKF